MTFYVIQLVTFSSVLYVVLYMLVFSLCKVCFLYVQKGVFPKQSCLAGIPFGSVNLRHGVDEHESKVRSLLCLCYVQLS